MTGLSHLNIKVQKRNFTIIVVQCIFKKFKNIYPLGKRLTNGSLLAMVLDDFAVHDLLMEFL